MGREWKRGEKRKEEREGNGRLGRGIEKGGRRGIKGEKGRGEGKGKRREGKRREGKRREGKRREGKRKEGKGRVQRPWIRPWINALSLTRVNPNHR